MSNLSVIVDFIILSGEEDPKRIFLADSSNWGVAQDLPSYLEVTPPGSTKKINLTFAKEKFTILNSVNLGLSCYTSGCNEQILVDLPDGVWEFCLSSSFENLNKKRYFLKDDTLRLDVDKIYIRLGLDYDNSSDIMKGLRRIEHFLIAAKVFIKRGDIVKAKRAYDEASKITERYLNCKDCY